MIQCRYTDSYFFFFSSSSSSFFFFFFCITAVALLIVVHPPRQAVYAGEPVLISCLSATYVHWWMKNGGKLPDHLHHMTYKSGIVIEKAAVQDSGLYTCITAFEGEADEASGELFVGGEFDSYTDFTLIKI